MIHGTFYRHINHSEKEVRFGEMLSSTHRTASSLRKKKTSTNESGANFVEGNGLSERKITGSEKTDETMDHLTSPAFRKTKV